MPLAEPGWPAPQGKTTQERAAITPLFRASIAGSGILAAAPERPPAVGPRCRNRNDQRLPQIHDADRTTAFAFHESEPENIRLKIFPVNGCFTSHPKQSLHRLPTRFRLQRHEKDWLPDWPA